MKSFSRIIACVCAAIGFVEASHADIVTGLQLYMTMDETAGLVAHDSSGNGNDGNLTGFSGDNSYWTAAWITNGLTVQGNDYVLVPDSPSINFTNQKCFSIAAWIKIVNPTVQTAGAGVIAKGTGGGSEQYDLDLNPAGSGVRYRLVVRNASGSAATTLSSAAAPVNNVWTHVVCVCDATNTVSKTLKMYINGQLSASTTNNANLGTGLRFTTTALGLGARTGSATSGYNLAVTNTSFDEVRLYNRPLAASDVYELYSLYGKLARITVQPRSITNYVGDYAPFTVAIDNNNSTLPVGYQWHWYGTNIPNATNATMVLTNVQLTSSGPYDLAISNAIGTTNSQTVFLQVQPLPSADIAANLVGYWKFDDASGSTTAADSTANNDPGTLVGFSDYNACWVTGLTNGALSFNGDASTANLVAIPNVGTPGPAVLDFHASPAFTLAAWVKASLPQTNGAAIFCRGTGNGGEQYAMDINGSNFRFYARDTNAIAVNLNTTTPLNGTWQHVAVSFDAINNIMAMYVNGQLVNVTVAPYSINTNSHEVSIGNRQSGPATAYDRPFTGGIDDARIYSRALTSADVQALYAAGGLYPPSFSTQPVGGSVYVGEDFRFSAAVGGTVPIFYQWRTNNVNLPGATNLTLQLTNIQLANAGSYTLVASNGYGIATSTPPALLQVTSFYLTNLLAGWWKFDDAAGATAADASPNGNFGSLIGFATDDSEWISGRRGGALNFTPNVPPANTQYVAVADAPSLNFDGSLAFTLSAWVRGPTTQPQSAAIICKGTGGGGEHYCIDVQNGAYRFFCRNAAGAAPGIVTTNVPTGQWQHLAVSFDGNQGFMRFYINGQLVGTNAAPNSLLPTSHELSIGCRQSAAGAYNLPFNGAIDDMRIYSRALSAYDVQALYTEAGVLAPIFYAQPSSYSRYVGDNVLFTASADGTAPLSYQWQKGGVDVSGATNSSLLITNLQSGNGGSYSLRVTNSAGPSNSVSAVLTISTFDIANTRGYWRFDETTGTTAADSSGHGNNGTLNNMPLDNSEWIPGRVNGALNFNADASGDDYVSIPDAPALNFDTGLEFGVAAWVKGTPTQLNGSAILAKGTGAGGEQYALDVNAGVYRFYVRNAAGASVNTVTAVAPNNRWQHVAAAFDGAIGLSQLYINGQLAGTAQVANSLLTNSHEVSIGSRQSGVGGYNLPFTGAIDDVRLYDRALTSNDVYQIIAVAGVLAPVIYTQPQSATRYVHDSVSFTVQADGTDPLSYQWKKDGNDIPGATTTILTLADVGFSDARGYTVRVTDANSSILSSSAILTVNPLPAADLTTELAVYYAFDETTGTAVSDSSGHANTATLFGTFPGDDSQWTPGIIGGALLLNNGVVDNLVGTDNPIAFDNQTLFSFSFWAKRSPGATGTNPRFVSPNGANGWVVWTPGRGVGFLTPLVSTEPSSNAWHHFVVTYDRGGGAYSLFVDGVRQISQAGGYTRPDPGTSYWTIGHSESSTSNGDSWTGLLDDFRIYNRLLNYNDVQGLYFAGGPPGLSVANNGGTVTISWPRGADADGYHLYSTSTLSGGTWSAVGGTPSVSADGASLSVTFSNTTGNNFYRLQRP